MPLPAVIQRRQFSIRFLLLMFLACLAALFVYEVGGWWWLLLLATTIVVPVVVTWLHKEATVQDFERSICIGGHAIWISVCIALVTGITMPMLIALWISFVILLYWAYRASGELGKGVARLMVQLALRSSIYGIVVLLTIYCVFRFAP